MRGTILLLACLLLPLAGEVIDRIAIIAGRDVITQSQIDEELRVTALLNDQPIKRDAAARKAAAGHLIEQLLVKRDMELSDYPLPHAAEVNQYADQVRMALSQSGNFDATLHMYGLNWNILREHLQLQLTTLRFIEFRFRPDLGISSSDIQGYYEREIGRWKTAHPGARPPGLAELKESIRKTLAEHRTDEALDNWLEERRKQTAVEYLDKSLQ